MKKHESSLKKDEVLDILNNFAQNINAHSEMIVPEVKNKEKNNET